MKIRQKLLLGFLATSLMVGMTGYISAFTNLHIKNDIKQLINGSFQEVEGGTEMTFALQAIQTYAQELIVKKYRGILEVEYTAQAEKEIQNAQRNIKTKSAEFKNHLALSQQATETSIQMTENELKQKQGEEAELETLKKIETGFFRFEQLLAQYIILVNTDYQEAEKFFDESIEPYFINQLLPLIRRYEQDAESELVLEARQIEEHTIRTDKLISFTTTLALLLAITCGFIISNSISKPIIKLKTAAVKFGKGQLDTPINIKSNDEIGILANAFNQMITDLKVTTVSKTYVDNIINSMLDSLIVLDSQAIITKVNNSTLELLGYQEIDLVGKHINVIFPQEAVDIELELGNFVNKDYVKNIEMAYFTKDGRKIPVSFSASVIQDDYGNSQGIVCVAQDITNRQQAEAALRESEERYALAAKGANDGLWDWDLRTNKVYFSTRWKSMLGYCENEISNSAEETFSLVHPEDLEQVQNAIANHIEGLTPILEIEYRILHKDGNYRWFLSRGLAVQDHDGKAYRLAGSQTDITQRKAAAAQLLHDALHDALTGLANRALFMDRLQQAIKRGKRYEDYLFAVLFLDLDRFKVINDSLGHSVGDELIIAIARRVEKCLRAGDTFARLGGDEFTIFLDNIHNLEDATLVADRIQNELALPFTINGHEVFSGTSIGITLSTTSYERPEDILRDADVTMYRAKALGKGRYEVFDPTMHLQAMALLQLETDLRRAVENQEFILHYQPIISLQTGIIAGFEALLRWQHPQRGLIYPGEFISLAEDTGLILPIGFWVLRHACHQVCLWQKQFSIRPPLIISVNVSGKQFSDPNFINQIQQIIKETQINTDNLKLEITESVLMENPESITAKLTQLQVLGVKLSIDDFGTGYSSLNYLHRFPIDTLKIDRSFVNNIDSDPEKIKIIRTVVELAWNLGMDVVAEGVETKKQMYQLQALKCEYAQGYLFSKPLSSDMAAALLATKPQLIAM